MSPRGYNSVGSVRGTVTGQTRHGRGPCARGYLSSTSAGDTGGRCYSLLDRITLALGIPLRVLVVILCAGVDRDSAEERVGECAFRPLKYDLHFYPFVVPFPGPSFPHLVVAHDNLGVYAGW